MQKVAKNAAKTTTKTNQQQHPLGLHLLFPNNEFAKITSNLATNLQEGKLAVVQAVFKK